MQEEILLRRDTMPFSVDIHLDDDGTIQFQTGSNGLLDVVEQGLSANANFVYVAKGLIRLTVVFEELQSGHRGI